jgi:hypothetical protein
MTNFKALDADTYIRKMKKKGRQVDRDTANYQVWNGVVKAYSQALLTVPGDKLIALSGIAKRMKPSVNDDTYVAGMWRTHFESALLWRVEKYQKIDGSPSS